jgi:histone deacetylase complex regulatory component SIN3
MICKNLPKSEQEHCKKFEELLRQNSHSPEFASRRKTRFTTQSILRKDSKKTNDDLHDLVDFRHSKTLYEIELESLCASDTFYHNIMIGGLDAANDQSVLIENEIQGIITIGEENDPDKFAYVRNGYYIVPKKHENFIKTALKLVYIPLQSMLEKGRVLVHSREGQILAPVIVIAFLMKKFNMIYTSAKEKVLSFHPHMLIPSNLETELKKLHH